LLLRPALGWAALLAVALLRLDPRHPLVVGSVAVLATLAALWGLRHLQRPAAGETELRIEEGSGGLREAELTVRQGKKGPDVYLRRRG
jgi:hypothetical protein